MTEENNYYKMDSTDGRSLIQPLKYKHDVLAQTWIDARILATLCLWMESKEVMPKSLSEVVRLPLEMLVEKLIESGQTKMVENTVDAREVLQRRFRSVLNRGGRGLKNVLHNSVLSSIRPEAEKPVADKELVDKASKMYNELFVENLNE